MTDPVQLVLADVVRGLFDWSHLVVAALLAPVRVPACPAQQSSADVEAAVISSQHVLQVVFYIVFLICGGIVGGVGSVVGGVGGVGGGVGDVGGVVGGVGDIDDECVGDDCDCVSEDDDDDDGD